MACRTGVIIRSYHLTRFLRAVIFNYAWLDRILIANFRFPNVRVADDKTIEIANETGLPNITIFGDGSETKDQSAVLDESLKQLKDCELVFISDADEFILKDDQIRIIEETPPDSIRVTCNMLDYADYNSIYKPRGHTPIVAVRHGVQFIGTRECIGRTKFYPNITMHNFGYSHTDEDMKWKHDNCWYPASEFDKVICVEKKEQSVPEGLFDVFAL